MAAEVGMSEPEYWDQIIKACYLDYPDPIAERKTLYTQLESVRLWLSDLKIEKLHVV
jgi:aminopeptidase